MPSSSRLPSSGAVNGSFPAVHRYTGAAIKCNPLCETDENGNLSGFITVDWEAFKAASNYDEFHDNAPESGGANTGANAGMIREKSLGIFGEVNGRHKGPFGFRPIAAAGNQGQPQGLIHPRLGMTRGQVLRLRGGFAPA